jgi:hypothetical protein
MSIQKKSLLSTLKTAKKANVATATTHEADAKGAKVASMRVVNSKKMGNLRATTTLKTFKTVSSKKSSFRQI